MPINFESIMYVSSLCCDTSVYQFESLNDATVDDDYFNESSVNSCAVIYDGDDDFGEVQTLPTSLQNPSCHTLPSAKIDPASIQHLSKNQQRELLDLLDQYPECFSDVPGFTNVVTHTIPLLDGFKPKRLPAYRVPERLKPEVSRQIREMLDNGIIRPSQSPMASPLVCILKGRDGCDGVRL